MATKKKKKKLRKLYPDEEWSPRYTKCSEKLSSRLPFIQQCGITTYNLLIYAQDIIEGYVINP